MSGRLTEEYVTGLERRIAEQRKELRSLHERLRDGDEGKLRANRHARQRIAKLALIIGFADGQVAEPIRRSTSAQGRAVSTPSASERLRALDVAMTPGSWHFIEPRWNREQTWINAGSTDSPNGQFVADLASPAFENVDRLTVYGDGEGITTLRNVLPALADVVGVLERIEALKPSVASDLTFVRIAAATALARLRDKLERAS